MNQLTIRGTQSFMGKEIPVVLGGFGPDKKCISDKTIAEIHEQPEREIRRRITDNLKRFHKNVDYIDMAQRVGESHTLEMLKQMGYSQQAIVQAEHIYLLSERGYAKLIKIMDTDLAWEIHDKLIDEYFKLREEKKNSRKQISDKSSELRAKAMSLNAANRAAVILTDAYDKAGIEPNYTVLALLDLYRNEGISLPAPKMETEEKTYDRTEMAKFLGVMSKSGEPHSTAIGAVLSKLDIPEDMIIRAPYTNNGHSSDYARYKEPILHMVQDWLDEHGWPHLIPMSNGKNCNVRYKKQSA